MNPGQSSPSSKLSTVPETAPTAKRMPNALLQRRASSFQSGSRFRSHSPSTTRSSSGRPTPMEAKTMWKPSDTPICALPAMYSVKLGRLRNARVARAGPLGKEKHVQCRAQAKVRWLGCSFQTLLGAYREPALSPGQGKVVDGRNPERPGHAPPRVANHQFKAPVGDFVGGCPGDAVTHACSGGAATPRPQNQGITSRPPKARRGRRGGRGGRRPAHTPLRRAGGAAPPPASPPRAL